MTDNKNISPEGKKDLKYADMDRFGGKRQSFDDADATIKEKKAKTKQKKKNQTDPQGSGKVPLALDISIAVVIIAVVVALIVGAYFLFKYYADSYKDAKVDYTVLIIDEDAGAITDPATLKNKEIYCDLDDNTYYFGKVTSAKIIAVEDDNSDGQLTLKISVTTKYKRGEGYLIDGNRIAVGSEYSLRIGEKTYNVAIVEMNVGGSK